jgi:hypothetical protein
MARDGGYRRWEPYIELADPPAWRAEAAAQVGRLLAERLSNEGRWERLAAELVHRVRATPLWSSGALAAPRASLMVDRVVDLRLVLQLLVDHPHDCGTILDMLAVGCVVSESEAVQLGLVRPPAGWEAYEVARIRVTNRETSAQIDVSGAARRQRELLQRLRTVAAAHDTNGAHSPWPAPEERNRRGGGQHAAEDTSPVVEIGVDGRPSIQVTEPFVAALRALIGEAATITRGPDWISASGPLESVKVTFNRMPPRTALVVAQVRDSDGHEHRAADVVRHISAHELQPATTSALVRVLETARLGADVRVRTEAIRRPQPAPPPPPPPPPTPA